MKKLLILLFFFISITATFSQRIRTTPSFDADTTTRPKPGLYGIGVRSNNAYLIPATGNNTRLANYSLFTSLSTGSIAEWNGTRLVNSPITDNGTSVSISTSLGLGTASPLNLLHINSSSTPSVSQIRVTANNLGSVSILNYSAGNSALNFDSDFTGATWVARNTSAFQIYNVGGNLNFNANSGLTVGGAFTPTTRMTLNSLGSVGIGTTALTGYNLRVLKNITGAVSSFGITSEGSIQNDVTTQGVGFLSSLSVAAAPSAQSLTFLLHNRTLQGTIGANITVGTQIGYWADASMVGATNNYGFRGAIASATGRWNTFNDGTAQNHFRGNVGIGSGKTVPVFELDVAGTTQSTAFRLSANNTAPATSTTACTTGELRIDGNFIYYCSATNTWKRAALSTY